MYINTLLKFKYTMSEIIHVNHNLGNEWGWFIDFVDEIEIVDELLKPQINYSKITYTIKATATDIITTTEKIKTIKPVSNNCFEYLFGDITNLLVLGTLYKLAKAIINYFN